jgi:hypothetical protein
MMVLGFPVLTVTDLDRVGLVEADFDGFGDECPSLRFGLALDFASSSLGPLLLRGGWVAPGFRAVRLVAPVRRSDLADEGRAARFTLTVMGNQPILVQGFPPDWSGRNEH